MEFEKGQSAKDIPNLPLIEFIDSLKKSLDEDFKTKISDFKRVGLRVFTIKTESRDFHTLRNLYFDKMPVLKPLSGSNIHLEDLAYIAECKYDEKYHVRVQSGPFQKTEGKKYFQVIKPDIETGLIADIDLATYKETMPSFSFFQIFQIRCSILGEVMKKLWIP